MGTRSFVIIPGDCLTALRSMPDESVNCCVTSPPYWGLRDYGNKGQIGLEPTPDEYVQRIVEVFGEVRRVMKSDGTLWLNLGDCYATGAGKVGDCPGGGVQGERFKECGPFAGHRGSRGGSPKHKQVPDSKNPNAGIPAFQPNRMPLPGLKPKDLVGIPWRVAFALQADGWWLRSDIIWHKPNPMPESVTDRPTKAHEYMFLLTKSERYYYDSEAIKEPFTTDPKENYPERAKITGRGDQASNNACPGSPQQSKSGGFPPKQSQLGKRTYTGFNARWDASEENGTAPIGRNKRTVWTVCTTPYPEAHFAVYPPSLIEPCILAGSAEDGVVLDPFAGSGTTGVVALRHGRSFIGVELNPAYCEMARRRIADDSPLFNEEELRIPLCQSTSESEERTA